MKTYLKLYYFAVALILVITSSCTKRVWNPPTVGKISIVEITATKVKISCEVTLDGGFPISNFGICWSKSPNPTYSNSIIENYPKGGWIINTEIIDLSPGTTYFIRGYASSIIGMVYGEENQFTTDFLSPSLTTEPITGILSNQAISGGKIISDGGSQIIEKGVCWSSYNTPDYNDNRTNEGSGSSNYISVLTGLNPGSSYFVRSYAKNVKGISYGNPLSFTTAATTPSLITTDVSDITTSTAKSGGEIINDGGAEVIARGVCWSTNQYPTILGNKTSDGLGSGSFNSSIIGLTSGTTYYVRAYATNSAGTGYGNEVNFVAGGPGGAPLSITDVDGNTYNTVTIGSQIWMRENLKTTKYRNGNLIGTTNPANLDISNNQIYPSPKYQWAYAGNENYVTIYGRLYTWHAVVDSRGICPTGWHVPTDFEWNTLTLYLGGESVTGGKLKETGTSKWLNPNTGATNSTGFSALPGGYRGTAGGFGYIGNHGNWWSSTSESLSNAWYRLIYNNTSNINRVITNKAIGYSVRCVKD